MTKRREERSQQEVQARAWFRDAAASCAQKAVNLAVQHWPKAYMTEREAGIIILGALQANFLVFAQKWGLLDDERAQRSIRDIASAYMKRATGLDVEVEVRDVSGEGEVP